MLVFKVYDYFHDAKVWCVFDRLCQSVKKLQNFYTFFSGRLRLSHISLYLCDYEKGGCATIRV